jgi:hypothetical protein
MLRCSPCFEALFSDLDRYEAFSEASYRGNCSATKDNAWESDLPMIHSDSGTEDAWRVRSECAGRFETDQNAAI